MAQKFYSATAPGSMMLFGEHAVLAGKTAIVCAVQQKIKVVLTPRTDDIITIADAKLGQYQSAIADLSVAAPFTFVTSAILEFQAAVAMHHGFDLKISAEFASSIGLGSSAAVTAATVAVLAASYKLAPCNKQEIFTIAKRAILRVQQVGSGADLAASVYGGVLAYRIDPPQIIPLSSIPDFTAVYCGYKTPTPQVIALVAQRQQQDPQFYAQVYNEMQQCVLAAIQAIQANAWHDLGALFDQHQKLQAQLGTSDDLIDQLLARLAAEPEILGVKISGSGLGDCIIGLGTLPAKVFTEQMHMRVASQGVTSDFY